MKNYPSYRVDIPSEVTELLNTMIRERKNDVNDFNSLNNTFLSGRSVARIPTGATDVLPTDKVGDFNIADDAGTVYLYSLVNISGAAEWRRVALSSW